MIRNNHINEHNFITIMLIVLRTICFPSLNTAKLSIILIFFLPSLSFGEKLNITLIPSNNSNAYTITADNIKSTIKEINEDSVQIRVITMGEVYSEKGSLSDDTDLFVPIGQRALKEVLKYSGNTPILASLIAESAFLNITKKSNISNKHLNIGAIYIDQPLKRHILFSQLVLPGAIRPGYIISRNNTITINNLGTLVDKDIHHIEILNPGDNVISTLSLILEDSDVIIALPDPIVFNLRTTRNILLSTYRKRVPIIGFSKSYVKAGALAAIYSTPEFIGKQTGEVIINLINNSPENNNSLSLPRLNSKYFSISVNNRVSRSLGLPILDAEALKKKLLFLESGRHE